LERQDVRVLVRDRETINERRDEVGHGVRGMGARGIADGYSLRS
jgi:hypothetical protein